MINALIYNIQKKKRTERIKFLLWSLKIKISEPALELHSRAAPGVGGNTTAQLVQPQGEKSQRKAEQKNTEKDDVQEIWNEIMIDLQKFIQWTSVCLE